MGHVRAEKGTLSVGGMQTKLQATAHAVASGVQVIIANGKEAVRIPGIIAGTDNDVNNLSIAVTAHELNPKLFVVARQNHNSNQEGW